MQSCEHFTDREMLFSQMTPSSPKGPTRFAPWSESKDPAYICMASIKTCLLVRGKCGQAPDKLRLNEAVFHWILFLFFLSCPYI